MVVNRNGAVIICDDAGRELGDPLDVPGGSVLKVEDGQKIKAREALAEWDPFNYPILTEKGGIVRFEDIVEGQTMRDEIDATGSSRKIIIEHKGELHPQISIVDNDGNTIVCYSMPEKATLWFRKVMLLSRVLLLLVLLVKRVAVLRILQVVYHV